MKTDFIEESLLIPENVWGFFEWTTGSLRLNISYKDFKTGNLDPLEQETLNETIDHEMFHCYQILTTGYLYFMTSKMTQYVINQTKDLILEVLEDKISTKVYAKVIEKKIRVSEEFSKYFNKLDIQNRLGISSRDIIESSAYLFQKKNRNKKLNLERFKKKLAFAPSPSYSKAFFYAEKEIEFFSLELYQLISYISLLFYNPQNVFPDICSFFKKNKYDLLEEYKVNELLTFLSKKEPYIGSSWTFINEKLNGSTNPIYHDSLTIITEITKNRYNGYFHKLMSVPEEWHDDFYTKINRPLIFNPDTVAYFKSNTDNKATVAPKLLAIIAGLSLLIVKDDEVGPKFLKLKKNDT